MTLGWWESKDSAVKGHLFPAPGMKKSSPAGCLDPYDKEDKQRNFWISLTEKRWKMYQISLSNSFILADSTGVCQQLTRDKTDILWIIQEKPYKLGRNDSCNPGKAVLDYSHKRKGKWKPILKWQDFSWQIFHQRKRASVMKMKKVNDEMKWMRWEEQIQLNKRACHSIRKWGSPWEILIFGRNNPWSSENRKMIDQGLFHVWRKKKETAQGSLFFF